MNVYKSKTYSRVLLFHSFFYLFPLLKHFAILSKSLWFRFVCTSNFRKWAWITMNLICVLEFYHGIFPVGNGVKSIYNSFIRALNRIRIYFILWTLIKFLKLILMMLHYTSNITRLVYIIDMHFLTFKSS